MLPRRLRSSVWLPLVRLFVTNTIAIGANTSRGGDLTIWTAMLQSGRSRGRPRSPAWRGRQPQTSTSASPPVSAGQSGAGARWSTAGVTCSRYTETGGQETSAGLYKSCAALACFSGTFELIVVQVLFCFVLFCLDQYRTVSLVVVSCWIGSLNKQTK